MMTKKHYIGIAKILKKHDISEIVCEELSEIFKLDNPNFDLVRFKETCLN